MEDTKAMAAAFIELDKQKRLEIKINLLGNMECYDYLRRGICPGISYTDQFVDRLCQRCRLLIEKVRELEEAKG